MSDLSVADAMALSNKDCFGFGEGGAYWIIILFLFMFASGGLGMFGGYNNAALQGSLTRADLTGEFNTQNILRQATDNGNRLEDRFYTLNNTMRDGFTTTAAEIANLGYNMQAIGCALGKEVGDAKSEILTSNALNTRDILESNVTNTQRIIDKITDYEMNSLKNKIQEYEIQLSNITQTANIINQVRPFPVPAYITTSPYQSSVYNGTCGCGYNTL